MYHGKVVIGIGGSVGSGKTTVGKMFESLGAYYISADEIGWGVLPDISQKLRKYFGADIMKGGKIDRDRLAKRVFHNRKDLDFLNRISHPALTRRLKHQITQAEKEIVVIDAALLYDWPDIMEIVDYPIVVTAPEAEKEARSIARGMDRSRYRSIRKNQHDDAYLSRKAQFIIKNNGTVDALFDQCQGIMKEIKHDHRM